MGWTLAILLLAVVFAPVIWRRLFTLQIRRYQGPDIADLTYQEVFFENTQQGIGLAGMLFVPVGMGPFPAVVIIHGSGTSHRNSIWYLTLAEHLQKNGIVVLLPDKRGSEKSQGNWRSASLEDLATDTISALDYIKTQANLAISSLGIVGMSQGGWIAPIVAAQYQLSFVVNVVGASVTAHEQLMYEENWTLREIGFLPGISNLISYLTTFIVRSVTQKAFWKIVGNFDPIPYWRNVNVPVLVMYGSDDTNVPTIASKKRFSSLGKENITVKIYEGSGHALEDPPGQGNRIFRKEALGDIVEFIKVINVRH